MPGSTSNSSATILRCRSAELGKSKPQNQAAPTSQWGPPIVVLPTGHCVVIWSWNAGGSTSSGAG